MNWCNWTAMNSHLTIVVKIISTLARYRISISPGSISSHTVLIVWKRYLPIQSKVQNSWRILFSESNRLNLNLTCWLLSSEINILNLPLHSYLIWSNFCYDIECFVIYKMEGITEVNCFIQVVHCSLRLKSLH